MNHFQQTIPCPACNNQIPFDTHQLLQGVKFICSQCNAAIGMAVESKPLVANAMEKLEQVKRRG